MCPDTCKKCTRWQYERRSQAVSDIEVGLIVCQAQNVGKFKHLDVGFDLSEFCHIICSDVGNFVNLKHLENYMELTRK